MSPYSDFLRERQAIDALLQKGFTFAAACEDLDGMSVRFLKKGPEPERAELRLLTADARKYLVSLLFTQRKRG
jgi:hypothetical protein